MKMVKPMGAVRATCVVACTMGAPLAVASPAQAQGGPAAVVVDAVRLEPVQEHRKVTGELVALRRSMVATQEGGLVIEMPVREGQRLEAGQVIARLDSKRLELELARAKADGDAIESLIEERNAELAWKSQELELYKQSAERGAVGVKEMIEAESAHTIAAARARWAQNQQTLNQATLDLLQDRLDDTTIKAPFDGIIVTRQAELGEWVGEGDAIVELVSIGRIEAWLDVPQQYFDAVTSADLEISIRVDASGHTIRTGDLRIVPLMDRRARSFELVAAMDDAGGRLTPRMSITAWIPTGATADRLTVSRDAVLRNNAGAFVYVARGGDEGPAQAMPVNVKELFPAGRRVVVESAGLQAGDLVVVEGNERLFPMMPVIPMPRASTESGGDPGAPR